MPYPYYFTEIEDKSAMSEPIYMIKETYVYVNFKDENHCLKYDQFKQASGSSKDYLDKSITEIIFVLQTGLIMMRERNGLIESLEEYDPEKTLVDITEVIDISHENKVDDKIYTMYGWYNSKLKTWFITKTKKNTLPEDELFIQMLCKVSDKELNNLSDQPLVGDIVAATNNNQNYEIINIIENTWKN